MVTRRWRRSLIAALAALGIVALPGTAALAAPETIDIPRDTQTVIHNPGMGWLMYVEEYEADLPDPAEFWQRMDPYVDSASGIYIRVPWSRAEPTEGHYAWDNDPRWKGLVEGAKKRGLALSFRIYVDLQDSHVQPTPEYVFQAGAEVARRAANKKDTYANDPVFMQKYAKFVQAFGREYGDPLTTDFVDMNTIGNWGEMHGAHIKPGGKSWGQVVDWLHQTYAQAFPNTMIVMNYATAPNGTAAYDRSVNNGAVMRRDGVGSIKWFDDNNKRKIKQNRDRSIFIAENCYQAFTKRKTSCDAGFKPLDQMATRVVTEALDLHANYLDLRKDIDVIWWNQQQPELVKKFAMEGGYRIAPSTAEIDRDMIAARQESPLKVTWQNTGVGRIPNNVHGWQGRFSIKYQVVNAAEQVVATIDSATDPGTITSAAAVSDTVTLPALQPGKYKLRAAITDARRGNAPGIRLAAASVATQKTPQWVPLTDIEVPNPSVDTATQTDPAITNPTDDKGTQTDPQTDPGTGGTGSTGTDTPGDKPYLPGIGGLDGVGKDGTQDTSNATGSTGNGIPAGKIESGLPGVSTEKQSTDQKSEQVQSQSAKNNEGEVPNKSAGNANSKQGRPAANGQSVPKQPAQSGPTHAHHRALAATGASPLPSAVAGALLLAAAGVIAGTRRARN